MAADSSVCLTTSEVLLLGCLHAVAHTDPQFRTRTYQALPGSQVSKVLQLLPRVCSYCCSEKDTMLTSPLVNQYWPQKKLHYSLLTRMACCVGFMCAFAVYLGVLLKKTEDKKQRNTLASIKTP